MPNFDQLSFFLEKYFPDSTTSEQRDQFQKAFDAYVEWNEKINVISRKDIENLAERHFLHSFAIAKVMSFKSGARVLDAGTGGGFPGIPLAILFPDTSFHLVDSRGKKITVVQNVVQAVGMENVQSTVQRVEQLDGQYDFVLSRAVAPMEKFIPWVWKKVKAWGKHPLSNGILYLRGGDVEGEMKAMNMKGVKWKVYPISDFFEEEFFKEKYVLHAWWK